MIMNRPREHLDSSLRWLGRREGARSLQNDIVSHSKQWPLRVIMNHIMIQMMQGHEMHGGFQMEATMFYTEL